MASDDQKPGGFKVSDRRSFTESGEPRPDEAPAPKPPGGDVPAPGGSSSETALPPVDFHTFVLSLGSSALLHLGELEAPGTEGVQKDLALAKHTIDVLAMLEEKTRGNLSPAEEKLISSLLYDLRLRYVESTKG
jgi:hypothetical protein